MGGKRLVTIDRGRVEINKRGGEGDVTSKEGYKSLITRAAKGVGGKKGEVIVLHFRELGKKSNFSTGGLQWAQSASTIGTPPGDSTIRVVQHTLTRLS